MKLNFGTYITVLIGVLFTIVSNQVQARPDEPPKVKMESPNIQSGKKQEISLYNQPKKVVNNARRLYKELDLSAAETILDKDVFVTAYIGFQNLVKEGKATEGNHILSICDFSLSANVPRLWVLDLRRKKLLYNTLVAHGQGTGEEFATKFSNIENSHQSSLGFYITDETYNGQNGYSLKMHGMDLGFNHNAYDRAIVIHGAHYVSKDFIKGNKRLGRSWGCPALPQALARPIIDRIKEGSVFYIHYPQQRYLASSKWINTPIGADIKDMYLDDPTSDKKKKHYAQRSVQSTDTLISPVQTQPINKSNLK